MKKIKLMTIICMMIMVMSISTVYSAKTSGSASVDIMSHYIWRGQKLSNSGVIQPSVGINYGVFGANLWANYDTSTSEHNETDLTLNYVRSVDKLSFDAGYIYYALEGVDDTQEIYISVGYDTIFSPTATLYIDFDEGDGAYLIIAASHSIEISKKIFLDLGASVGVNFDNRVLGTDLSGDEFSDFYDGNLSASIAIPVTDNISLSPIVAYTFPLSSDAEDAIRAISDDSDSDLLYGGVNFTLSF